MLVLIGLGVTLALGITAAYVAGKGALKLKEQQEEIEDLKKRVKALESKQEFAKIDYYWLLAVNKGQN